MVNEKCKKCNWLTYIVDEFGFPQEIRRIVECNECKYFLKSNNKDNFKDKIISNEKPMKKLLRKYLLDWIGGKNGKDTKKQ